MQKTAEAVSLGHPDQTADYISSYLLDRFIEQDPATKYAVEVMLKDNTVILGGEITSKGKLGDIKAHVQQALREIGYDERYAEIWGENAIDVRKIEVINLIGQQSPEIAQGVENNGWGDQGVFVGYACKGDGLISKEQYLARFLKTPFISRPARVKTSGLISKRKLPSMITGILRRQLSPFRCLNTKI